jgi:hypothetical protein
VADRDVGIEGKAAHEFSSQFHTADRLPDYKRTRRTDVDGVEMLELRR